MRWIYYKTVNFPGIDSCSEKASAFCSSSTRRNIKSNKYISNPMTTGFIMSKLIHVISMEFLSLSLGRSSWRNVPSSESKEKRLYSQGRLCKMADNRSKYINMNRKKSVKKNRNPIRLCILPFYTIIFTTPFKSVQIVAWLSQNHRQATNPAREPHIIWQRPSPLSACPRAFFFFLPSLPAIQRGLCGGESCGATSSLWELSTIAAVIIYVICSSCRDAVV